MHPACPASLLDLPALLLGGRAAAVVEVALLAAAGIGMAVRMGRRARA